MYTPILLHDHNEFLNEKIFLEGINIFCNIVTEIASVWKVGFQMSFKTLCLSDLRAEIKCILMFHLRLAEIYPFNMNKSSLIKLWHQLRKMICGSERSRQDVIRATSNLLYGYFLLVPIAGTSEKLEFQPSGFRQCQTPQSCSMITMSSWMRKYFLMESPSSATSLKRLQMPEILYIYTFVSKIC